MKIILAEHFGMCFGVRDAIAQAEQIGAKGELTILGELVHNPIVRERLHAQGIREAGLGHALPQSARVMITAHGASDARRAELRAAGFKVADATCPLVHHAHDALKRLVAAGFFPIVIGKAGHVEVECVTRRRRRGPPTATCGPAWPAHAQTQTRPVAWLPGQTRRRQPTRGRQARVRASG